jgi:hypothetical protein
VLAPDEVQRIDGYDAALTGSGVYVGRWLEPAKDLLARHKFPLSAIPAWLFSSGPIGEPLKPAEEPVDAWPLAALVGARGHRTFPGMVDRKRKGFARRAGSPIQRGRYPNALAGPVVLTRAQLPADPPPDGAAAGPRVQRHRATGENH